MKDDVYMSKGGRVRLRKERSVDEEKDEGKLELREVGFVVDHFGRER